MNLLEGKLVARKGARIAIVASRFNEFITSRLLSGCEDGLVRHGVATEQIDVAWVPGAFEIPVVAQRLAESGRYDAVICLGAVIRGSTSHYDYVCAEVSKGVAQVGLKTCLLYTSVLPHGKAPADAADCEFHPACAGGGAACLSDAARLSHNL